MKLEELRNSQPGDRCLICSGRPDFIGIFIPNDPIRWGAPAGKTRFVRYCLCEKCHGRQDTPERVEKIVRAELLGGVINDQ